MRTNNEKTCEVLNDLIRINHDRVEGYKKAKEEIDASKFDLINTFQEMAEQSNQYISELGVIINKYAGTIATDSTVMGALYKTWMDLKTAFSVQERKNVLGSCEYGEDAAQKAYKTAMEEDNIGEEARSLIAMQKNTLKDSHDLIKAMRNREKLHAAS